MIFNRHHTTPRPAPPPPSQQAAASHSPTHNPGLASLELLLPSSACGGGGEGKSAAADGSGGGAFFERDTRDRSTSTCTTSCASNAGGECCRIGSCDEFGASAGAVAGELGSAATATTAPPSASPDLRGSGALRFDGSVLWGRQHLGLDDNAHHGGRGGAGAGGNGNGFCCWDEETAANGGGGESGGDLGEPGDSPETGGAGTKGTTSVPLVVGGATLKVDWADPLRYHIHLNGGIKGPSASPEFGMPPDGRPGSRGGGGGGDTFPGGRMSQVGSGSAPGNVSANFDFPLLERAAVRICACPPVVQLPPSLPARFLFRFVVRL